jgi:hypothetical protein
VKITSADNGKVLGFPLLKGDGTPNDFTGAAASLNLRNEAGNVLTRPLVWNPNTTEWEYSLVAGELTMGRWRAMVAVTFAGPIGPVYSTEVIIDVIAAD